MYSQNEVQLWGIASYYVTIYLDYLTIFMFTAYSSYNIYTFVLIIFMIS